MNQQVKKRVNENINVVKLKVAYSFKNYQGLYHVITLHSIRTWFDSPSEPHGDGADDAQSRTR